MTSKEKEEFFAGLKAVFDIRGNDDDNFSNVTKALNTGDPKKMIKMRDQMKAKCSNWKSRWEDE